MYLTFRLSHQSVIPDLGYKIVSSVAWGYKMAYCIFSNIDFFHRIILHQRSNAKFISSLATSLVDIVTGQTCYRVV